MDLLNELNTKREDYSQALTQNQNDLVKARSVLAKLKEQYDIDKPVIDRLESEDKVLIEKQKSTGIKIEVLANKIEELKRSIVVIQKELAGVFLFSVGKKRELRSKLESRERHLEQMTQQLAVLEKQKSVIVKQRNTEELEAKRTYFLQIQKDIIDAEKQIETLTLCADELISGILQIDQDIEKENDQIAQIRKDELSQVQADPKKIKSEDSTSLNLESGTSVEKGIPCNETKTSKAYYIIYGVEPEDYADVDIQSLNFSVRLTNRLIEENYHTVAELLKSNDDIIEKIRGFGKGCFDELHTYLGTLDSEKQKVRTDSLPNELFQFKEKIIKGDFSFTSELELSDASWKYINRYKEAHAVLDSGFVEELVNGTPAALQIYVMLAEFIKRDEEKKKVQNILNEIPANRLAEKISWLITCHSSDVNTVNYLNSLVADETPSLESYIVSNADRLLSGDHRLVQFVRWCQFELHEDLKQLFANAIKNERELQVIQGRAAGKTLDAIGKSFDITRERVRQIEKKVVRKFNNWQKRNRIMYKIFIELKETAGLSTMELMDAVGEHGREFVYLIKNCEDSEFIYDKQLDLFMIESLSIADKVQAYVESMPDTFPERKLAGFIKTAEKEFEYPEKLVSAAIEDNYKKTGDTYHRFRLTLESMYSDILKRFYPDGIHVYDADEIEHFRMHVNEEYGIDISDKSDHAIGSILSRIGILCGRGIYKLRQEKLYITKELSQKIHDYIEDSPAPIFMTNTLYSVFEDDLIEQGVDNKYYLQGILRELYEAEWIFRRDYISKDESYTSVYSSIVGFIRNSQYPVTKEEIQRAFPGVTEIVINFSVSDHNIINLFGQYIHSCRLKLSDRDIKYIRDVVEQNLIKNGVCHCKDIYEYINEEYPVLLTNNFISYPFSLYSLLEYLFGDYYNFSRPYIARKNATIERVDDLLHDMIRESEKISLSDIMAFAREHHFVIANILEFIDSCNETHLLMNDMELASIDYIGVTAEIAAILEKRISEEIDCTVPIHQLQSVSTLPEINVEWNTWLIYSVIKKWGVSLEVAASNNQFRHSYPLVAPKGRMDISQMDPSTGEHDGQLVMADDLSKIDELIGDYVLEGLGDIDEL